MRHTIILFLFLLLPWGTAGSVSPLSSHYSPYLAMHADDPVQWQLWGEEIIQQAQREDKLIFISSGYFACHWCHVMQQESFRNPAIANVLKRVAIPVKIDRELNPELDTVLLEFVERTRGAAGWPLNVFLTPEGYPLVGTVYLPAEELLRFVERLEQRWQTEKAVLAPLARKAAQQHSKRQSVAASELELSKLRERVRERLVEAIEEEGDFLAGGLGDGAKFPNVPLLEALLLQVERDDSLKAFTVLTLEQMAAQGLHDHLGGGFFRYTVDPNWQQPHFEKMLYANALLARLYLHAAKVLQQPVWREVALETIDFTLREMWHREGAFISSLSAVDEAGIEGGYYLWTREQLLELLTEGEFRLVNLAWSFHRSEEWVEGGLPIPSLSREAVAEELGLPATTVSVQLNGIRQMLLQARQQRTLPRDEKRLAGWNGLALSVLSEVAVMNQRYRQAGRVVRDYLHSLWDGEQLWRIKGQPGALEDYVYVAQGLLDWAGASDDQQSRELAVRLVDIAWQRFHHEAGWYRGEGKVLRAMSSASPMLSDGALPSPSAAWCQLARKLGSNGQWRECFQADLVTLLATPLFYPSYIVELAQREK